MGRSKFTASIGPLSSSVTTFVADRLSIDK